MKYKFNYFYDRHAEEKVEEIEADNDVEAVMKFYDIVGIAEFGCIRADGHFFTDDKFPKERAKIKIGC
ncbi:MAG TPA: hypothetical protein VJ895_01295 [Candidatus Nanoarchaeia archaeon]|nr:hypothetical protein [Candidatus Nanoarchaeia archaeon]